MKKLEKAVRFAAKAHAGMFRKGLRQPYLFHPLEVLALASTITDDENILCACVLHDVVEDAGVSIEEIKKKFGKKVADIVDLESEDKMTGVPKSKSWKVRKEVAIERLRESGGIGSKIICLCDKTSNLRSFHLMKLQEGEKVWDNFNQKDPLMHYWYYDEMRKVLTELSGTAVYKEYSFLIETIFGEYKGE